MAVEKSLAAQLVSPWPWHRWLGLFAAAFVIWLAVTGILLAHADDLRLAQRPVRLTWVLDLWQVPASDATVGFPTHAGWVVAGEDATVVAGSELKVDLGTLVGATDLGEDSVVVGAHALALIGSDGALLEQDPLPLALAERPLAVAADAGRLVVRTTERTLQLDPSSFEWAAVEDAGQHPWSVARPLPADQRAAANVALRAHALDWERVLRDLHAWRTLGRWSVWFADLIAITLIALSLTGALMFLQRRRSERSDGDQPKGPPA